MRAGGGVVGVGIDGSEEWVAVAGALAQRQYLSFCTSAANKLSVPGGVVVVGIEERGVKV